MAQKSLRVYEQFDEIVGGPPVFTRTGMVLIVNEKDKPGLDVNLKMQQELGIDVRPVSAQVLADIDPNARLKEDEIADLRGRGRLCRIGAGRRVLCRGGAPRRGGHSPRRRSRKRRHRKGNKIVGVETNEGRYNSGCVILATGPWAAQLGKDLGVKLPVQACRTQVALYRRPPDFGRRSAVYCDFVQGIYFKPTHGEMIHAGSLAGRGDQPARRSRSIQRSRRRRLAAVVRQRLSRRYPAMHRSYGRGGYGALYAITPDWHPIMDKLPGLEGAYCAVGFSGHGFKMSPIVGQLMAELIVDGKASALDIAPLRYTRFDENDPVKTPYSYGVMGRVLALDLHAAQIQGFFRHPGRSPACLAQSSNGYVRSLNIPRRTFVVLSPDEGSIKRRSCYQKKARRRPSPSWTNAGSAPPRRSQAT